jgi:hypothetical protein
MPGPDRLLRHIGYAEDWLRRARYDWRKGDGPGALRRLILAEAEIRHARENGAALGSQGGPRQPVPAWRLVAGLAGAAVLAAGIGYASMWSGAPERSPIAAQGGMRGAAGGGFGRSIVQLDSGRFLMPDPAQDDSAGAAGGLAMPEPGADGAPARRPARVGEVPVDLRTSSPKF